MASWVVECCLVGNVGSNDWFSSTKYGQNTFYFCELQLAKYVIYFRSSLTLAVILVS